MADHAASPYATAARTQETSGVAVGFIVFASMMMILSGSFQVITGLIALFNDEFYVATANYVFQFDVTTWGWIHLLLGVVVAAAGIGLLAARTWARVVGITIAMLSALVSFAWLPYYPVWALVVITLDVFVIWALAAHGDDIATA
jgi:hypothetical protein